MFKYVVFAALLAVAFAAPEAKPGVLAAAPLVGAPLAYTAGYAAPLAYSAPIVKAAYTAPVAYSAGYAAPLAYSAGYAAPLAYSAYPAYSSPLVKYY